MNPTRVIPAGTPVTVAVLGTHTWTRILLPAPIRFRHSRRAGEHLIVEHDGSAICVEAGKVRAIPRLPMSQPNRRSRKC